ncbi:MAG: hypothetical protein ACI80S_002123 [Pseudohongiellaceae bacterium]
MLSPKYLGHLHHRFCSCYARAELEADSDIDSILLNIVETSIKNNKRLEITGVLFLHNQIYLQIIEGTQDVLECLMNRLHIDSRHTNIVKIIDEEISSRSFGSWSMDSFNLSGDESIDLRELTKIGDVGKRGLKINSEVLLKFYKTMLRSHSLTND